MKPRFFGFVLMSNKKKGLYKKLFKFLRDEYFVEPRRLTSDYELAMRSAASRVWPNVLMSGCAFHYRQALRRKFLKIFDSNVRSERRRDCRIIMRMFYNIQMLPADKMQMGFSATKRQQQRYDLNEQFEAFNDYFLNYWLQKITPENFTMHQVEHRTNNFNESFNAKMSRELCKHPNIYDFLDFMKKAIIQENHKIMSGQVYQQQSQMTEPLEKAWAEMDNQVISISQFLKTDFSH